MKLVDLVLDSASQKKKKKYSSRLFPIYGTKTRAALLAGSILAVLCLVFAFTLYYLSSPAGGGRKATIKIEPQSSTGEIATKLHDSGMIHSAAYFKLYAQLTGADTSLKAGKYVFQGTENLAEIIRELQKGTPEISSFTVPEGYTLEQITNLLDSKGIVPRAEFMAALKESQVSFPYLKELPEGQNRFEGFLFPDTYNVTEGMEAGEIIQMMLDKFSKIYTLEMRKRAEELNLTTKQVVTLASIIEREAQKPEDRPLVSAVFHNRLKINMALQSCATVQYALGETKPVLNYMDTQVDSPYNTYLNTGLPPGPISVPGEESLKAALHPAGVSYLYFVAKPDGSHVFSNTLDEHNAAKRKYIN